ncbi:MAG: GYF domain-containing protein [Polyangiaceae bacterium]
MEPRLVDPAQKDASYHWLMPDGARLSGTEQELRAALASGVLTAASFVWRKGWAEWQAVERVPELASALPAKASEHKSSPTAVHMPPLVARDTLTTSIRPTAPTIRTPSLSNPATRPSRNAGPSPGAHEVARDTLAPAPTPSSFGNLGGTRRPAAPTRRESGPPPPPVRGRAPLPTLSEEAGVISVTATLRPPGAVPPAPRGVPSPSLDPSPFSAEKRGGTLTPVPAFGPPGGKFERTSPRFGAEPSAAIALGAGANLLTPSITQPSTAPLERPPVVNQTGLSTLAPVETAPELEPSLDSTLEVVAKVPPEARRTPVEPLAPARSAPAEPEHATPPQRDSLVKVGRIGLESRTVVLALSGLSGALLVAVIALALSRGDAKAPEPDVRASVSASPAPALAPAVIPGCRLLLPAARISANVERAVPAYVAQLPNQAALALGFAETKSKGVGLRLNPATLDVTPSFEEDGKDAVRGVVPLTHSGSLAFFVDRDDKALHSAHTVDEVPPFTLGVNEAGFSRVVAGATSLVWPLDGGVKITEPRSAPLGAYGYGIAFRRGGQAGSVLLGFVDSDGKKKTELAGIPNAPKLLGTPVIAGSAAGALVAFAGRDAEDSPWQLFVSLTKPGAAPSPARALLTGSGGAISPALAPLGADRFLVQWTEGSSGKYHVHVQSFGSDLSPIGQSVLVSPKGANAGQGSVVAFAGQAATLFILTTAGHDELWGATLACP